MEVVKCLFIIQMLVAHQVLQVLTSVHQVSDLLVEVPIMLVWCVGVSSDRICHYQPVDYRTVVYEDICG